MTVTPASYDFEGIRKAAGRWRSSGMTIVFTNGCFDLIHPGHVRYLGQARALGDLLVVGLNTDESVRALKGVHRPILNLAERTEVLLALRCVDAVVPFAEPTPLELIREVRPHVLVKGGDWPVERIVGREVVQADGGRVISLPFLEGASTTEIIQRIRGTKP
ncbi:MAG: D-glycero-beta-D-manno-heptose 1-phosphate adenylyltransferase [bacterium]|nr:MAG: D-glycero-beta-D-manno-heptose 1-phosphate adenylyltransferase [bacterium]